MRFAGGFAIFVAIMFVVFMSLFAWTAPVIDAIDHAFAWSRAQLHAFLPGGIVGGSGGLLPEHDV